MHRVQIEQVPVHTDGTVELVLADGGSFSFGGPKNGSFPCRWCIATPAHGTARRQPKEAGVNADSNLVRLDLAHFRQSSTDIVSISMSLGTAACWACRGLRFLGARLAAESQASGTCTRPGTGAFSGQPPCGQDETVQFVRRLAC